MLFTYLSQHYTPKRMVVAGVGVEHFKLVDAVQKYFVDVKPLWETEIELANRKNLNCDRSIAQYTGGMVQVRIFDGYVRLMSKKCAFCRKSVIFRNSLLLGCRFCHTL